MSEVQLLDFRGNQVRIISDDFGEPMWVAADIARVLEYRDANTMFRGVDDEDKGYAKVRTPGGAQTMTTVNESGLYTAIVRANSDRARAFRRWITTEVLPSIRRTGSYSVVEKPLSGHELMAAAVLEAQKVLAEREDRIRELEPKAAAWANLASVGGDLSVSEAAKVLSRDPDISIGRQRLFDFMEEIGWIFRAGSGRRAHWEPYQRHVDNGRLVAKFGKPFFNSRTEEWEQAAPTLRVTPKGIEALRDRLAVGSQLSII
ncbi:Phage antirepressor protein KilAC domain protein [Corynebacterium kalinowskii]|uniref:Phage antirepressor protein KilAC domain protein n=1 Tax=Corynebacterium kalinowskii TaxID=2675216 RepID=A0A6B8VT77_9CORY|nr:phage antirepressor KilAC domain-containing protein [Corynebacterium kalinowskii]QGU03131.1 Phage antirepressor protein KilAC domain protein [Corynebacterium kalinowskii]